MKLSEFVVEQAVVPQLKSDKRDDAIAELIDALVSGELIDGALRGELIRLIIEREEKGSTGFGKGVAVPHVKHAGIPRMAAAIGISHKGVDFNALDTAPVYSIVLLLSPEDRPDEHLQAMENIFSNLQKDTFRRFLRQATEVSEVLELINEADSQQLQG